MKTEEKGPNRGGRPAARVWRACLCLALLVILAFVVVAPPERCPTVTAPELRGSAQAAAGWLIRNQGADGTWLYLYDRDEDSAAPEYNEVRHAGAIMGLYRAASEGIPGALASADRGTKWALARMVDRDGWSAFGTTSEVDTGASALLVAGLALRREATGDPRYDAVMRRMGRFLVAQTEPSGAVLASYDTLRGEPVAGSHSKYFTGEAYWALALLHRAFPSAAWDQAADRIGAYLASSRDDEEGYWPPIADHWAAYGLSETTEFPERGEPPLTADQASYARTQAELFGAQVRWISERFGPWGALVRPGGVPRGGGYGVIAEGLSGLWLTAMRDPRLADLRAPIAERASCVAALAVRAQSDGEDAAGFARPDRVEGAWFRDGETRMDDQQHALAGLLRTIPIVEAGVPSSPARDEEAPSAWLWALLLVLALNPVRAAFGIPRAGRSPRDSIGLAALGGGLGALVVCAAALAGDPLLDALDVTDSSFRIAAGVVAALAGLADLLMRPPPSEPSLPGWRAALTPVAFPLVARPALLVIVLGAGAERGGAVPAAGMAIGIGVLIALTARWPADASKLRALGWAIRLAAAGLIACGVMVCVDGVFDV